MSLFNYLDEQTKKKKEDKSFMGMGSIWQEMGKPIVESIDKGLLKPAEPEPTWSYGSYDPDKFEGSLAGDKYIKEGVESRGEGGWFWKGLGYGDDFARSTVDNKWLQMVQNLAPSTGELYKGLSHIVTHPGEFLGQMTDLVQGGLLHSGALPSSMFDDEGRNEKEMASQMWDYMKTTYGTWEGFKNHAIKNPAEFLLDLSGAGFTLRAGYRVGTSAAFKGKITKVMERVDALGRAVTPPSAFASPMAAWHGSPWRFRNFRLAHMGKGEGAQQYGYGLYFGQNKKTGQSYVPPDQFMEDFLFNNYCNNKNKGDALLTDIYEFARSGETPNDLRRYINDAKKDLSADDYTRAMAEIDDIADVYQGSQGSFLYKVEINDAHIKTMIDYDVPVWQQPEAVKALLWKEEPHYMRVVEKYGKLWKREQAITKELQAISKQSLKDIEVQYNKTGKLPNTFDEGAMDFFDTPLQKKLRTEQIKLNKEMDGMNLQVGGIGN